MDLIYIQAAFLPFNYLSFFILQIKYKYYARKRIVQGVFHFRSYNTADGLVRF
jgi:hypothetical protein